MKKQTLLLLLIPLALFSPSVSFAVTGSYTACDEINEEGECFGEQTVYYEGLIPCGKKVLIGGAGGEETEMPCQLCHFFVMFKAILDFLFLPPDGLIWIIGLAMIVIGGFLMLVSEANPSWRQKANSIFRSVAIGLSICLAAWLITNLFFLVIGVADWTGLSATGEDRWFQIECPIYIPD